MKRWIYVGGVAILILSIIAWAYFRSGIREYLGARAAIQRLSIEKQAMAESDFFAEGDEDKYGGILAGTFADRVWIWGKRGLRGFKIDQYSVYSFFSLCRPGLIQKIQEGGGMTVDREVYPTATEWRAHVKVGDFVTAMITKEDMGGEIGNMREIYGYDWWVFLPGVSTSQCEK